MCKLCFKNKYIPAIYRCSQDGQIKCITESVVGVWRLGPEAGQAGEHVAGEAEQVEDDLDRAVRGEQPLAEDVQNYSEEESEGKRN